MRNLEGSRFEPERTEGSSSSQETICRSYSAASFPTELDQAQRGISPDSGAASDSRRARGRPGSCGPDRTRARSCGCSAARVEAPRGGCRRLHARAPPAWLRPIWSLPTCAATAVDEAKAREADGGVRRVAAGLDGQAYSKGTLPPKGRSIQCPWSSAQMLYVRVGQPDEDVCGRVSHTEYVETGPWWNFGRQSGSFGQGLWSPGGPVERDVASKSPTRRHLRGRNPPCRSRRRSVASCSASMSLWRGSKVRSSAATVTMNFPCGSRGPRPRRLAGR